MLQYLKVSQTAPWGLCLACLRDLDKSLGSGAITRSPGTHRARAPAWLVQCQVGRPWGTSRHAFQRLHATQHAGQDGRTLRLHTPQEETAPHSSSRRSY